MPRDAPLALLVDLDRPAGLPDEAVVLRDAIHEFFHQRAQAFWQRLRDLFRVGRTSLAIGLVALAVAIAIGDFLASLMKGSRFGEIIRESLTIGGWVSMWRPVEIFLYDGTSTVEWGGDFQVTARDEKKTVDLIQGFLTAGLENLKKRHRKAA